MRDGIHIENLQAFLDGIDELVKAVDHATKTAVSEGASLIEREAKKGFAGQHNQGTPRPNPDETRPYSVTSALRRSIHRTPTTPARVGRGSYLQSVAPTMAYGRRIELGFSGTDSLGRLFNQRPYPFLQPAVRRVTPMLPAVFIRSWRRALEGEK